eukprot:sb/3477925/
MAVGSGATPRKWRQKCSGGTYIAIEFGAFCCVWRHIMAPTKKTISEIAPNHGSGATQNKMAIFGDSVHSPHFGAKWRHLFATWRHLANSMAPNGAIWRHLARTT